MSCDTTVVQSSPSRRRSIADTKKSPGSPLKKRKGTQSTHDYALQRGQNTDSSDEFDEDPSDGELAPDVKKILQDRAVAAVALSTPQHERYPADKRRTPAAVQAKTAGPSTESTRTPRGSDDTTSRKRLSLSGTTADADDSSSDSLRVPTGETRALRSGRGARLVAAAKVPVTMATEHPTLSTPDKFPPPVTGAQALGTPTSAEKLLHLARGSPPRSPQRSERLRKTQMLAPVLKTQGGRLLAQTLAASPKKSASSLSTSETFASVGTQPATTPKGKGKAPSKRRLPMPQKFLDLITKFGEFDRTVCHARKMSQRTFVALQHTVQARTHKDFTLYDLGQICAVFPTVYSLERLIIEKSPQLVVNNVLDAAGAVVGPGDRVSRTINLQPRLNDFCAKLEFRVKEHIANTMNTMFALSGTATTSSHISPDNIKRPPPGFDPEFRVPNIRTSSRNGDYDDSSVTQDVPDITPASLPEIRKKSTNKGVEVLVSPQTSTASATAALASPQRTASTASSTDAATDPSDAGTTAMGQPAGAGGQGDALKGVSSSLLERIRQKQGKRKEQKALAFNPNATLLNDLTHVLASVAFFVWGRKPAKGRMGLRFTTLAADLRRKNANLGTQTQCKQLLRLMIDEVGLCQQTTPATPDADKWCYVKTIVENRVAVEYIQIQASFNLTEFKAHLESRIASLRKT